MRSPASARAAEPMRWDSDEELDPSEIEPRPEPGSAGRRLVDATRLFSGADVEALVERVVDEVIEEALDSGGEPPLSMRHLETALPGLRRTTTGWLRAGP